MATTTTTTATTATASNVASRLLQHQQSLFHGSSNSTGTSALQHLLQTPSTPLPDRPFILVPLYIYPTQETWLPLYRAAEAHPTLDFYVVVNPANGPGEGALPDANYIEALVRLTALRNVWVIGYVHCNYGKRPAEDVVRDVEAYARWENEAGRLDEETSIVVDGIFVDETPSSTEFVEYMAVLSRAAKTALNRNVIIPVADAGAAGGGLTASINPASSFHDNSAEDQDDDDDDAEQDTYPGTVGGAGGGLTAPQHHFPPALTPSASSAIVIYNPGVVVDPIFYRAADYIVAFENAASQWTHPAVSHGLARLPRGLLRRSIVIAHSSGHGRTEREREREREREAHAREVTQLCKKAAEMGCMGHFITSRDGYTQWCGAWDEFVEEMARWAAME